MLSRKNSIDTIYTLSTDFTDADNPVAVIESSVNITFDGFNEGLARVGTGWAVAYSNNLRQASVRIFNSSGALDSSFTPFVESTRLTTFPNGLLYNPSTSRHLLFMIVNVGRFRGPHAISMDATGAFTADSLSSLGETLGRIAAVTDHDNTYLIMFENTLAGRSIPIYDSGFNDTGSPLLRDDADLGIVRALASFEGRVVVVTAGGFHLYGDAFPAPEPEPMPGDVGAPVRQLRTYYSYYQRFAIAKPGDAIEVKAHNFRAIQATDVSLNLLPGTLSLEQRFSLVEVTPEWTIPSAEIGDKVFLWSDDAAPTEIPDDALDVKGVLKVGDSYRQTLVCQEPEV